MHVHGPTSAETQRVLRISLWMTFGYILLTLFTGWRAHSLALVSEAGHNASDFLAILLSLVALYFQARPATSTKTFGYQRAGVLAAFVNAVTLIVLALWIAITAVERLFAPQPVQPRLMMIVAAAGLAMNGLIAALLARSSRDINIRGTFLHMLGDALSTGAVLIGAVVIEYLHTSWIDPVLSLVIAALVLWSSLGIVRETLNILLEGAPQGLAVEEIRAAMLSVSGVANVHDLHVWSLGSNTHALASHVTISDLPPSASNCILQEINHEMAHRFRIHHTTIQFEHQDCGMADDCLKAADAHDHAHGHSHAHSH